MGENDKALVSVVINCYNGDKYLREAIDSVLEQTYTNWEIIFWDNCSTDKSKKIAKEYNKKLKYYFSGKHTTLGEARNLALKKVKGDYIAFIDCDDIWLPNKLKIQVELMNANPNFILSYGSMIEINDEKIYLREISTKYKSGNIFGDLLEQFDVSIISSMINAKLLENSHVSFDNKIVASEEYCLFMQLAINNEIGVIRDYLVYYRVHESSLTSKAIKVLGDERRYTLDKIISNNGNLYSKLKRQFTTAYARSHYYDARWNMVEGKKLEAIKCMKKIAFLDYRFFLLFIISFLPTVIWNKIHFFVQGRL
jgi:glycosyltransferase involved in cell wall biosynthesis